MLELREVFAGYRDTGEILREISMQVEAGQTAAIYGLNGSGKSTLLRVCAGLLSPTRGTVKNTLGRPGYLQQNPRLQLLASTVREELALSLRRLHTPESLDGAIEEWLQRCSISGLSRRVPRELSGGQQQRVALSAILCRKPRFLLLDEPDAFLDGRSSGEFRDFVSEHCSDCAILWTHSRRSSAPRATRFFELRDGRLHASH
ncbi:energy-coupling factor ABC transporter ATP-binding protein [bacterium]|nr:energy-coupling factor ABC transporter ATP-binding protein [bacterium]